MNTTRARVSSLRAIRGGWLMGAACVAATVSAWATISPVATFPITLGDEGRIELRAQLIGYRATDVVPWGGWYPMLLQLRGASTQPSDLGALGFNGNDGEGGAGLSGILRGDATTALSAATTFYALAPTYAEIFGDQSGLDAWHTYTLVWNDAGLFDANHPGVNGNTVAVYLDGTLNSTWFRNDFVAGFFQGPGVLSLGGGTGTPGVYDPRDAAFDWLAVWNTSEALGSALVLSNQFNNASLFSEQGPDGAYQAGTFFDVPGGRALRTAVPEAGAPLGEAAAAWLLLIALRRRLRRLGPAR